MRCARPGAAAAPAGVRTQHTRLPARPATTSAAAAPRPITPGSSYPAGAFCSTCGLCDTPFISDVKDACAFLGPGMARLDALEPALHGRARSTDPDSPEIQYGVIQDQFYGRAVPSVPGAQWTGIVTAVACAALETGLVDAVVCVAGAADDPLCPRPTIARSPAEVRAAAGVKPCLSPTLEVLPALRSLAAAGDVQSALFIGVGCHVQAVRAVQAELGLEKLFVMGTNCTDNGPRAGLATFLEAASDSPSTAKHYEFHVDYRVHIVHEESEDGDGVRSPSGRPHRRTERIPYFSLPASQLTDVISPSCYSCFDYTNGAADLVVGYMGVPYGGDGTPMAGSWQHVVVRNGRGAALLAALGGTHGSGSANTRLETRPVESAGDRTALVRATVEADDAAKLGTGPSKPMPAWLGTLVAKVLTWLGPRGLEFGRYSVDYHVLRNALYVRRHWPAGRRAGGRSSGTGGGSVLDGVVGVLPAGARAIVERYDADGWLSKLAAQKGASPPGPVVKGRTGGGGTWVGGGRPARLDE